VQNAPELYYAEVTLISFVGAFALYATWMRTGRLGADSVRQEREPAIFWLASAFVVWGVCASILWVEQRSAGLEFNTALEQGIRSAASIVNSSFFLLALASFDYGPTVLRELEVGRRWVIVLAASAVMCVISLRRVDVTLVDKGLALIAAFALVVSLFRSFWERKFHLMALFSVLAVAMIIAVTAIPRISPGSEWSWLINTQWCLGLVFKVMLLACFLTLITSWVTEDHEWVVRRPTLFFRGLSNGSAYGVSIVLPGRRGLREIRMTRVPHSRLFLFAVARATTQDQGWVRLKDAGLDHKDLVRIAEQLTLRPRKIFDNDGMNRYRLRISADRIGWDASILKAPEVVDTFRRAHIRVPDAGRSLSENLDLTIPPPTR
jgi:hypothetical protein